jgi:signal transduction histidine kinase
VPWGDSQPTDRILMHLAEIGAGRCTITDDSIAAEADVEMRQVLLGLLVLHEDLTYSSELRTDAETKLRAIADERARLLEERRQAVAARDQFLAVAAHELRTPLATLALLVDHLVATLAASSTPETGSGPAHAPHLSILKRQVDRLTSLVTQMLDVSRITRGSLELVVAPVDLCDIVREVVERFELEFERRQVRVFVDAQPQVVGTWDGDRIDQVVTNLVSNALKYGAGRPIEIRLREVDGRAVLTVRDHGIGIADDEQSQIFAPFVRATSARHHAGLGLGLWIAHQIVQASKGQISVKSRLGEGSTFTVELPR